MTGSRSQFVHLWTEMLIRRLKRDSNYRLDERRPLRCLVEILNCRGWEAVRGFLIQRRLGASSGLLFIGKNVTIRHKKLLQTGRSVIIEDYVYIDALSKEGIRLGDSVTIGKFATIQCTGVVQDLGIGLRIGDNSAVGAYSYLGAQGGIKIGNNVIIGPKASLHSENHNYQDIGIPIRLQGTTRKGITIDDNCWIGASSTILDGVHIHAGCVVAAASAVTRDIPPNTVVAGVPARVIKRRGHKAE